MALANDKLELLVLKQGASVASVILRDDPAKLNPLWDPARMAREANGRSNFSSGTGQFLCVDGFGGVSNEEKAAGLPGHGGEAARRSRRARRLAEDGDVALELLPNRSMLSLTHRSAATASSRPRLAVTPGIWAKPSMPRR